MSVSNQFALFGICVGAGFVFGIVYEALSLTRLFFLPLKKCKKAVVFALDILFFILFALWCVGVFYLFGFPDFRLYYWLGFFVGGIIYLKSLHRIVAFFKKICYNKAVKIAKKLKIRKKQDKIQI